MNILISSDHGGFELKSKIISWIEELGLSNAVEDMGPFTLDPADDYPKFGFDLAEKLADGFNQGAPDALGILICRSGIGMSIVANKVDDIRAALCFSAEHAARARIDDHANILVLDSDYESEEEHFAIIKSFLSSEPELGGRHERRVYQITSYEKDN